MGAQWKAKGKELAANARGRVFGKLAKEIMVAARGHGLHTCPQAAWNGFAKIILPHIGAGEEEMLVCGMALGYADPSALVNTFHTPRQSASQFTHFVA